MSPDRVFSIVHGSVRILWDQDLEHLLDVTVVLIWDSLRRSRSVWVKSRKRIRKIKGNEIVGMVKQRSGISYKIWRCTWQRKEKLRGIKGAYLRQASIGDPLSEINSKENQLGIKDINKAQLNRESQLSKINFGSVKGLTTESEMIWSLKRCAMWIGDNEDLARLFNLRHPIDSASSLVRTKRLELRILRVGFSYRWLKFFFNLFLFGCRGKQMAQLALNKGKGALVRTDVVKVSGSVLAQRIQQFSLTLIGRLMNPSIQRMDYLVANMPKIWKLENKVVGADLGMGKFQFNFQSEEDLLGVLQNGPYHFDGWMVSLVRWEPIVSSSYPSAINFWVKVTDIPLHLWDEAALTAVGKKLGIIREIDEESGSVLVTVNGFNPILFQAVIPFDTGDEVVVSLEYDKLSGLCQHCSCLTHAASNCPELAKDIAKGREAPAERRPDAGKATYSQMVQKNEGAWEKPMRPPAKRALEFSGLDSKDHAPYKNNAGENNRYTQRKTDKYQSVNWVKKGGMHGMKEGGSSGSSEQKRQEKSALALTREVGRSSNWPAPLYQQASVEAQQQIEEKEKSVQLETVMETVQEVSASMDLVESISMPIEVVTEPENSALEDGEVSEQEPQKISKPNGVEDEADVESMETEIALQTEGTVNHKDKEGIKTGANNPFKKKGMVALPKPPAHT